ncbi:hypothetical protein R5R35_007557 [Gryllus longicercus]|uniref:Transposable element P transposase-like RNase H domain-containing protein n=1 Tax=Gryllus longicercus TaxID=2509291 RepID=A0AAN9Z7J6_9ORTH
MIQGLQRPYMQPVAYYFSQHTTPANVLAKLRVEVIEALQGIGFTVKAAVCDLAPTNTGALKSLIHASQTGEKNVCENIPLEIPPLHAEGVAHDAAETSSSSGEREGV